MLSQGDPIKSKLLLYSFFYSIEPLTTKSIKKSPRTRSPLLQWNSTTIRGMVTPDGDNLVVFQYLSTFEMLSDNRGNPLGGKGFFKKEATG